MGRGQESRGALGQGDRGRRAGHWGAGKRGMGTGSRRKGGKITGPYEDEDASPRANNWLLSNT